MEYTIKNILVPTDFSEISNNALNLAVTIAEKHCANLHLIHVVEPMILGKFANIQGKMVNIQKHMVKNAEEFISLHVQYLEKTTTLKITSEVIIDGIANGVANYEEDHQIDLTIIGTHGKSGYYEQLAGSNAMRIIKKSTVPVLSIPPMFSKKEFKRILFPVRINQDALQKYDILKPFVANQNTRLHILGVYEHDKIDDVNEIAEKVSEIRNVAQYNNLEISYNITPCNGIEKRILNISEELEAHLIVINATLDKRWYHFFMGNSFTDEIINNATVPVLSIKPKIDEEKANNYLDSLLETKDYTPINYFNI